MTGEKEIAEFNKIRKENYDLGKHLGEHVLRRMLLIWLILPLSFTLIFLTYYVFSYFGLIATTNSKTMIEVTTLVSLNSDIFTATITVIGIILGILPLLSFYYLGELKEMYTGICKNIKERKSRKTSEVKKALDGQERIYDVMVTNTQKAVKTYTKLTVGFSIFSLLLMLFVYLQIGIQDSINYGTSIMANNIALNIILNINILLYVVLEVFPIVNLALFDPGYKISRIKQNGKEYTMIIPEE